MEALVKQDEICRLLAEGESLRSICASEGMPSKSTVCRWLATDDGFRERYIAARELQAETLFEEILLIADSPKIGERITVKADGSTETVKADMVEHRRLQVDARRWMVGKMAPKRYGEASLIKLADADGGKIAEMTDVERAGRLAAIAHSINQSKEDL